MRNRTGCGYLVRCFLLALLLSAVTSWAGAQDQPTTPPPSPSTTALSQPTMPSWDDLEAASGELSQKANDLVSQAVDLNSQLAQLQSSLLESTTLLAQSLAMRKQEALAAQATFQAARNSGLWWQRIGLVASGVAAGYIIYPKAPGALYGAATGALVDVGLEVSGLFRIKL